MQCPNCGAALPIHSDVCEYCRSLNDLDLRRLKPDDIDWGGTTPYRCPRCSVLLQEFTVELPAPYSLARCPDCMGIFFTPLGELNALIDEVVPRLSDIDYRRLSNFVEESLRVEQSVRYIPCPECEKLMNRKNYGSLAGVIVDWCGDHGYWLDRGEFGKLLRWARSGGREFDARRRRERRRTTDRRRHF